MTVDADMIFKMVVAAGSVIWGAERGVYYRRSRRFAGEHGGLARIESTISAGQSSLASGQAVLAAKMDGLSDQFTRHDAADNETFTKIFDRLDDQAGRVSTIEGARAAEAEARLVGPRKAVTR